MRILLSLAVLAVLSLGAIPAAAAGFVIANTQVHEVRSDTLSRAYDLYIKLPKTYGNPENAQKLYPVVYLNDGPYTFQVASGVTRLPVNAGAFEEMILVGLSFAKGEGGMASRTRDMTPVAAKGWALETGGAGAYFEFLRDEAIPYVEANFRADPARRVLSGQSFGGLFGAWVLLTAPETFSAYILTSPSLWFADKAVFQMEEAYAGKHADMKAKVYFATGSLERPGRSTDNDLVADQQDFAARLRARQYSSLVIREEIIEGALHETTFPIGFTRGAQWLFYKNEE